ncbi:MAG: anhydro-N-acetylmuramic acid kinase [Burkholderiaceae bacterium]|nr:anhydro-N-acetylmuramic acid kinase [Burkholderiaceae bacterium]
MHALYAGLMSGTSLDGVDAVLVEASPDGRLRAHHHQPLPVRLHDELLALNARDGIDELARAAAAARDLADVYADSLAAVLAAAGVPATQVRAVGAHGQTVRHRPEQGYTIQLLDAARLAERSGVDVVANLRSRDVAAGGQGAPLVPAFHAARFARPGEDTAVLNLGGIANLTLLAADGGVLGFDTGPANALLDHWAQQHLGQAYDAHGAWAAGGRVDPGLLASLRDEAFFRARPPKSTGRDLFEPGWLQARLAAHPGITPQDVMATLLALTVSTVADALLSQAPHTTRLRVCGGGARNDALMAALARALPGMEVRDTHADGVAPEHVEAWAFAWLAQAFVERRPGNLPAVTGAIGPRILGALYPA